MPRPRLLPACLPLLACVTAFSAFAAASDWPQFRGPTGQGHSDATGLPLNWNDSQNIVWKTAIPGQGWSSPVVYGNQVWLTTAEEEGRSLRAICVDVNSGKILHNVEVFRPSAALPINPKNSYASPTPVIEEGRVYVHFGSAGTACLDTATARILWADASIIVDHKEGPGSSSVLWRDKLIVNFDGRDHRWVVAFNTKSGRIDWKTERSVAPDRNPEKNKAYCTPLIVEHEGRDVCINPGALRVSAYNPANGEELWWCNTNGGFSTVPRPVVAHGLTYICTGYPRSLLLAIPLEGQGDKASRIAWQFDRQVPLNPSLLVVGDELYMVSDRGILTCLDAKTGQELWTERLGGNYSASPMYADGRIFLCSEQGEVIVIQPGREYQELARTQMPGRIMATPAITGRAVLLRTDKELYRIEQGAGR